ncbi:hypothetical protein AB6A40_008604 [Gnathostoma spinigerum]|uniref:Uncharacterized protein n=1 Tax=Gnathostoma spinigerum TaxID=75299 RepID=A0ABD6EQT8_9BILA
MIDSVTVGFLGIVLLVVAVLLVIFKMFAKEKSFEEAYGPDALRLLTDEKSSKQKSKPAKARNRGGERKKETVNEKEESRLKSEVEPHSNSEIAQSSRTSESNEFAKQDVKHAKREKKSKEKYFDESKLREEITSEKRIQANDVQEEVTEAKIEMINAAVKQELSTEEVRVENSEKKVRKKNRPRRADDNNVSEIDKEANRQGTSLTGEGSEQEKSGLTREKKSEDRDKAKKCA